MGLPTFHREQFDEEQMLCLDSTGLPESHKRYQAQTLFRKEPCLSNYWNSFFNVSSVFLNILSIVNIISTSILSNIFSILHSRITIIQEAIPTHDQEFQNNLILILMWSTIVLITIRRMLTREFGRTPYRCQPDLHSEWARAVTAESTVDILHLSHVTPNRSDTFVIGDTGASSFVGTTGWGSKFIEAFAKSNIPVTECVPTTNFRMANGVAHPSVRMTQIKGIPYHLDLIEPPKDGGETPGLWSYKAMKQLGSRLLLRPHIRQKPAWLDPAFQDDNFSLTHNMKYICYILVIFEFTIFWLHVCVGRLERDQNQYADENGFRQPEYPLDSLFVASNAVNKNVLKEADVQS